MRHALMILVWYAAFSVQTGLSSETLDSLGSPHVPTVLLVLALGQLGDREAWVWGGLWGVTGDALQSTGFGFDTLADLLLTACVRGSRTLSVTRGAWWSIALFAGGSVLVRGPVLALLRTPSANLPLAWEGLPIATLTAACSTAALAGLLGWLLRSDK